MPSEGKNISIIEFTHPGRQLSFQTNRATTKYKYIDKEKFIGFRDWNQDSSGHYRKFLLSEGKYKKDFQSSPERDILLFWGEWEPHSYFKRIDNIDKLSPNAIHQPVYLDSSHEKSKRINFLSNCSPSKRDIIFHNTDPYVFGNYFYYSNCKQKSREFLRNLDRYSIILFGTEYNNQFVLDTVFVVNKIFPSSEYKSYKNNLDTLLRESTLELGKLYSDDQRLVLYQGLMHSDGEEMYSYVPCKLEKGNENGFKRPVLDIHKYDLQKYGAGSVSFRVQEDSTKEKVIQYWNKLTKDIVNQGYFLGVEIDSPKIIKTIGEGILFGDS